MLSGRERMNKKEFSLDKYWEDKLNFKYEEEILRYKMLCNDKISRKDAKKYNISLQYRTFSEWEKYIKEKISKISNEELREYQKYINLKRTNESSISGILNGFLVPFLIATVCPFIVQGFTSCIENKMDNVIIDMARWIVMIFSFFYIMRIYIKEIVKEEKEQKRSQLFYDDMYEILQKEIDERSNNDL